MVTCKVRPVTRIYVPSRGADDWRWLLANPGLHWKQDASAKALADAWENADAWPEPVASSLSTSPDLAAVELLLALPEHQTPLAGGNRASQTDLLVLAKTPTGELVTIAVEGKAQEPFGDTNVAGWRASASPGRTDRLRLLLSTLELEDDDRLAPIRYQLLHRTAAADHRGASLRRKPRCHARPIVQHARELTATMLGLRTSRRSPRSMA